MAGTLALNAQPWNFNPFIQRALSGPAFMKVAGTYTGSPVSIEARIEEVLTSTTVIDWFSVNANGTVGGGKFYFEPGFAPDSQYLRLKLRFSDDHSVALTSNTFGTGDNYLIVGQSLGEIFVGATGTSPSKAGAIHTYIPNAAESTALGLGGVEGWTVNVGDAAMTLANILIGSKNVGIGFTGLMKGGTPLTKEAAGNGAAHKQYLLSMEGDEANYYVEAMLLKSLEAIRTACAAQQQGVDFAGIIGIMGEADALAGVSTRIYFDALTRYYNILRGMTLRSPQQCPFYLSTVGKYSTGNMTPIREAMIQWARVTPGVVLIGDRYDLPRNDGDALYVHWSVPGAIRGAQRFGMSMLTHEGFTTVKGEGPTVVSGKRNSGTSITLKVDLKTHSGIAAANGGSPLTGFVVSASPTMSSPITLSNVVVSSGTIVLTTGSTFPTPAYIKFIPTAANSTDAANDNNVYSTDNVTGDSLGSPLQPTPYAIIVA